MSGGGCRGIRIQPVVPIAQNCGNDRRPPKRTDQSEHSKRISCTGKGIACALFVLFGGVTMKKLCWLLIITLSLGCLAACQNTDAEKDSTYLSQSQKEEIEKAWLETMESDLVWYDESIGGVRCYGSENGYIFLFAHGFLAVEDSCSIANCRFRFGDQFFLYAYKNGVFHNLEDIYSEGLVSKEAIRAAFKIHKTHLAENFPGIYEMYYGEQSSGHPTLKEILIAENEELLSEILEESHWDDSVADVEMEGQPMLLVYNLNLLGYTDRSYEQIVSHAQSKVNAEVHILRAKPIVLVEYQNKTKLGVNTNWYPKTPTFVKDVMYGSSVQIFFGESCTIENVICFTSRTTRQETNAVYETDKGRFVLYYEDNDASAVVFRWEQFVEYAKGYYKYVTAYENNYEIGTGSPLSGEPVRFLQYCEAPEEYVTIASQIKEWGIPAAIVLGIGIIGVCGYKVYRHKRGQSA